MEIAHISDLHIKVPLHKERWVRFLNKRTLGGLNMLLKRSHPLEIMDAAVADLQAHPPDHLVVTGDLTNLAFESEFERARDYLRRIGLPAERMTVIPGNHDTYTHGSGGRFERFIGPLLEAELSWPRAQRVGELLLVSTNSGIPTPWFCAYGRLGPEQLAALDRLLEAEAGAKVVLVHHPPVQRNGRPDIAIRRNHDGPALLEICRRRGVAMLLCGHTHRPFRFVENGLRLFCAGSTTQAPRHGRTPGYNRYRFEGGRLAALTVRRYDPDAGAFGDGGTESFD